MKSLGHYLARQQKEKPRSLDEKTMLFLVGELIQEEYGNIGWQKIRPVRYQDGKLFFHIESSSWANEIWTIRQRLVEKINQRIGSKEVREIKI